MHFSYLAQRRFEPISLEQQPPDVLNIPVTILVWMSHAFPSVSAAASASV
jgi:hypothetical protein